jgi:hypothetical protein
MYEVVLWDDLGFGLYPTPVKRVATIAEAACLVEQAADIVTAVCPTGSRELTSEEAAELGRCIRSKTKKSG